MDKRIEMIKDKFKNTKIKDNFVDYHIENTDKDFENWIDWIWCEENGINPYECSKSCTKKVKIFCQEKDYHGSYEISCANFTNGRRCSYCGNHKVHPLDSLGFLYHNIAKMIVEDERNNITYEDTYKIAPCSNKKYYIKCDKCNQGSTKPKWLVHIIKRGYSCEYCSDGISIPEKFMANILEQLEIEYMTQYNSDWSEGKRYDFYIPNSNIIIEMNGIQHYEESPMGRNLKEEQVNDEYKNDLALENEIENYVIVDCRYSTFEWLKRNVIKELSNVFDLSNIDWNEIWKNCQNSKCVKAWELWNQGLAMYQIAEKLKITRTTVIKYLKNGTKCKKCDYTEKESISRSHNTEEYKKKLSENHADFSGKNHPNAKSVICITTGRIFHTTTEGAEYYNCQTCHISACCKGKLKSSGKLNGTKLVWRYLVWNHNKIYRKCNK